jgi:hypothetical protein
MLVFEADDMFLCNRALHVVEAFLPTGSFLARQYSNAARAVCQ